MKFQLLGIAPVGTVQMQFPVDIAREIADRHSESVQRLRENRGSMPDIQARQILDRLVFHGQYPL